LVRSYSTAVMSHQVSKLDPKQSGFHDEPLPAPSWLSPITQHATHIRNYQRFWINRSERRVLMAQVIEYPLDKLASTEVYSLEQDPQGKVENKFTIAAVPYARGSVVNYGGVDTVLGVFVRGSRVFLIEVVTPRAAKASEADIEFTRRLVMIQAAKAPPGPTKPRNLGAPWLAAGTALGTLGAAVAYIGGLSLLAWLRDPLRRRLTSASPQPIALPNITTVDIAARARRRRRRTAAGWCSNSAAPERWWLGSCSYRPSGRWDSSSSRSALAWSGYPDSSQQRLAVRPSNRNYGRVGVGFESTAMRQSQPSVCSPTCSSWSCTALEQS
jgi:hypothetical protein